MSYITNVLFAGTAALALTGAAQACAPDFSGVTLNVGTQTGPAVASALRDAATVWEAKTCGKVNVVEYPFGDLLPKYVTALQAGSGDFNVMAFTPAWLPDLSPYLAEVPAAMQSGAEWDDIHPVYKERLMIWDGKVKAMQMDGDMHLLNYRGDLFEDPKEQAAFKAAYGYDLAPPKTWDQYYDIAKFFTRPDKKLYGTAEAYVRGGQQFWYFFSHAASYTNNPKTPGSMFFDPETMKAQINTPGWVKALEDYKKGLEFNPPGALNFGSGDVRPLYAGGTVAMNLDWADSGILGASATEGKIRGSVRTAVLPGSTQMWNTKTKTWDKFDAPVASPFLAFGGWQLGVDAKAENAEAAWDYVALVSSKEQSSKAVITANSGINPFRLSHYNDTKNWLSLFTPVEAESYLGAMKASLDAPNVTPDLRLPGYFSYTEILEIELSKVLAGDEEPQAALDTVATEWDKLTDQFGKDKQLAAYRASVGLPPL